jgi:hypothetical protein
MGGDGVQLHIVHTPIGRVGRVLANVGRVRADPTVRSDAGRFDFIKQAHQQIGRHRVDQVDQIRHPIFRVCTIKVTRAGQRVGRARHEFPFGVTSHAPAVVNLHNDFSVAFKTGVDGVSGRAPDSV